MAEQSDNGPNRRRIRTRQGEAHSIERGGQDPTGPLASANARRDATKVASVREAAHGAATFPQRIARKYLVTPPAHGTDERRVYADAHGEYLVFKDQGHRLTTRRHETVIVRDLVAIARHRDWTALHVTGSAAFRREVWLEAHGRGMDVSGYAPSPLDRKVLDRRDARRSTDGRHDPVRRPLREGGAERSGAFVADEGRESLRSTESGTPDRREDSTGRSADRPPDGAFHRRRRGHAGEDGWMRSPPSVPAVEDPRLAAAHSQIAVLDHAVRRAFPDNATMRDTVLRTARERVAFHLAEGRTLHRASYRVPIDEKARHFDGTGELNKIQSADKVTLDR